MLTAHDVKFRQRSYVNDDGETGVEITIDNRSAIVNTFAHCYCEFRFTDGGALAGISFGY
jgi:hypothetical protein